MIHMKVTKASQVKKFTDIPNVGKAMEADFILLGIKNPKNLIGKDPFVLYKKICKVTGQRQDPCVLDTYMSVTEFMNGTKAQPWWYYTKARKKKYPKI